MNRSKLNYKVYNGKTLKSLIENSKTLILTLIFTAGIIIGAVTLNNQSEIMINNYTDGYITLKSGQGIYDIFLHSLASNIIFPLINIFLSYSLIGYTLIIWLPFLKGLGIGAIIGNLYSQYGLSGFGYSLLTIIPGVIVSSFALIIACNAGYDYSKNAYSKSILGKGQFEKGETKYFIFKQLIYLLICISSSLIDTIFSAAFLRFFEF